MNRIELLNTLEDMLEDYSNLTKKVEIVKETIYTGEGDKLNSFEVDKITGLIAAVAKIRKEVDADIDQLNKIIG